MQHFLIRALCQSWITSKVCGQQCGLKRMRFNGLAKFAKIIMSWLWKPRHLVVMKGIFLFLNFLKEKINFRKYLGGVRNFWKLLCKRKAARKTTPRSNRLENQRCQRLKICFPCQNLARAHTLFNSVGLVASGADIEIQWITCYSADKC